MAFSTTNDTSCDAGVSAAIASTTTGATRGVAFSTTNGTSCDAGVSAAITSTTTGATVGVACSTTIGATITCSLAATCASLTSVKTCASLLSGKVTKLAKFPRLSALTCATTVSLTRISIILPASALPAIIAAPSVSTRTTSKLGVLGALSESVGFGATGSTSGVTATVSATATLGSRTGSGRLENAPLTYPATAKAPIKVAPAPTVTPVPDERKA